MTLKLENSSWKKGISPGDTNLLILLLRDQNNKFLVLRQNGDKLDVPVETYHAQSLIPESTILATLMKESCNLNVDNIRFTNLIRRAGFRSKIMFIVFRGFVSLNSIIKSDPMSYDFVDIKDLLKMSTILNSIDESRVRELFKDTLNKRPILWSIYDDDDQFIDNVVSHNGDLAVLKLKETISSAIYAEPNIDQQTSI